MGEAVIAGASCKRRPPCHAAEAIYLASALWLEGGMTGRLGPQQRMAVQGRTADLAGGPRNDALAPEAAIDCDG